MPKIPQDLCFLDGFFPFLLTHMIDTDLFNNKHFSSLFLTNKISLPKGSFSKQLFFLIHLIFTLENSDLHLIYILYLPRQPISIHLTLAIDSSHPINISSTPSDYKSLENYIVMKKTKKYLKFQDIELTALQEHPRDISRARLKIIDTCNQNAAFKTFAYGTVQPTKVHWSSPIEMPFTAQDSLQFETVCEHEYGYEIEELKALYNGVLYIKPDQFFFYNTAHVLNQQGQQCGTLRLMVKIVEKEEAKNAQEKEQEVQPKQPVKVNLVAKVSIYGATLAVNPYFLNTFHKKKKRRNLKLSIRYASETYNGTARFGELEYKWSLNCKFEVNDNSPQIISISIYEDDQPYLEGTLTMATLESNKRFTVQIVQLMDQNQQNIAALQLDLRYISKKQLLDLMYSPTQLAQNKLQRKQEQHHFKQSRVASMMGDIKAEKEKKLQILLHNRSHSKEVLEGRDKMSPLKRYRYKQSHQHDNSTIPRSVRFSSSRPNNQYVSYIDPALYSDFSPQNAVRRGATQSSTPKTDFTKLLKANPGVGEYHLPSIWEKK